MRKMTKFDVINDMTKKTCWDIKQELATDATQDIECGNFYIYSAMHYKTVYNIIKAKLQTLDDPILKIGYIDCLIMNYTDLGSEKVNTALDVASGLASGSILGFSLKDMALDSKEVVLTALVLFVIQAIKACNLLFRKWNFYISVLQQIKDELSERED